MYSGEIFESDAMGPYQYTYELQWSFSTISITWVVCNLFLYGYAISRDGATALTTSRPLLGDGEKNIEKDTNASKKPRGRRLMHPEI